MASTATPTETTGAQTPIAKEASTRTESPEDAQRRESILKRFGSKLGDLPQLKVGGKLLRGRSLRWSIGAIASCGFCMFGYDQGVLSALLTLDSFQRDIPLMTLRIQSHDLCWRNNPLNTVPDPAQCTGNADVQAFGVAIYQIGCFLGATRILFRGEKWGRRSSTFWGSLIMILGTVMHAAAYGYGVFVAGRIIGGVGNGMVTSTIPTRQSECAKSNRRGLLVMLSGALVAGGIMVAYWIDYGFYFLSGTIRWRVPVAIQMEFTIALMAGLLFLPDSPRWLMMRGRVEEARELTAHLLDKDAWDAEVEQEINAIQEGLNAQSCKGPFRMSELLSNGPAQNLRRTFISMAAQFFQQICGINLVTYYATFLFENSLGFDPAKAQLWAAINGTEYFVASLVAISIIERMGRVRLMMLGAFGMIGSMAMLAGATSMGSPLPNGAVRLDAAWGWTASAVLFVFNTFALGWLGTTWLYPAEITGLRIRIQANALATSANWIANFLIVMIMPPAFANLGYRTYIIFAIVNALLIPTIFLTFPEPQGRELEETDIIFASAHREGISPVEMAKRMAKLDREEIERRLAELFSPDEPEARRTSAMSFGAVRWAGRMPVSASAPAPLPSVSRAEEATRPLSPRVAEAVPVSCSLPASPRTRPADTGRGRDEQTIGGVKEVKQILGEQAKQTSQQDVDNTMPL